MLMNVEGSRIGLTPLREYDVINLRVPESEVGILLRRRGFLPAYHMAAREWVTILLDGTVPMEELLQLLDRSFRLTGEAAGFQLAGADGVFYPAAASFAPNRITLTAEAVPRPEYARYAWTNYLAPVTVFGMNGLPLAPFRTDSFGAQTAENTEKRNAPSASAE